MIRYNNYKIFLKSVDFTLQTEFEDFNLTNIMTFTCPKEHNTTITIDSFANKKAKFKGESSLLCTQC